MKLPKFHKDLQGIAYLMGAYVCFAMLNIVSKQLYTLNMDPMVITFYRSFIGLVLIAPFMVFMVVKKHAYRFAKINVYKGVLDFLSIPVWIMAVSYMNIPEAVGLSYLTPLLIAMLAIVFLKDKMSFDKWMVMLVGLTGAYIILKPDFDNFNYYSIYALAACLLWATGSIITKNLTDNQHPIFIVFFTNMVIAALALPFLIINFRLLSMHEAMLCIGMAATAVGGYLFLAYAYRSTKLSNLVPYDYFRLIFATITSYIFLGQVIDSSTIIGSALIFGSSIYLARKQIAKSKAVEQV